MTNSGHAHSMRFLFQAGGLPSMCWNLRNGSRCTPIIFTSVTYTPYSQLMYKGHDILEAPELSFELHSEVLVWKCRRTKHQSHWSIQNVKTRSLRRPSKSLERACCKSCFEITSWTVGGRAASGCWVLQRIWEAVQGIHTAAAGGAPSGDKYTCRLWAWIRWRASLRTESGSVLHSFFQGEIYWSLPPPECCHEDLTIMTAFSLGLVGSICRNRKSPYISHALCCWPYNLR